MTEGTQLDMWDALEKNVGVEVKLRFKSGEKLTARILGLKRNTVSFEYEPRHVWRLVMRYELVDEIVSVEQIEPHKDRVRSDNEPPW